jgi:hypothetical protein
MTLTQAELEAMGRERLREAIAAGRMSPQPSPELLRQIAVLIRPALVRMAQAEAEARRRTRSTRRRQVRGGAQDE